MKVAFNPVVSQNLKSYKSASLPFKGEGEAVNQEAVNPEKPAKKKTSFKEGIADVWKFFSVSGNMISASFKGLISGTLTAGGLLATAWLFRALPKAFDKNGPTMAEIIKKPLKHVGLSGKIIAGIGGAGVLAYHLIAGKLKANQDTADIDHKLKVGHRQG